MEKILYEKKFNKVDSNYNIWCAFPGCYSFAMSSLGYLWLYKLMDDEDYINVERIYSDSKNTRIKPKDVDAICFSVSFDLDFIYVFQMLEKYNFPILSKDRTEDMPLIFAGGPTITANPVPYKDFFDFLILGDGEEVNLKVTNILSEMKSQGKKKTLEILSTIEGVYVPVIEQKSVVKATAKINKCVYLPILSDEAFFSNMFILEISRGCANCCGFCLASYLNLPVRFAPVENILETIDLGLKHTNKIALLGAQVSIHPKFKQICQYIYEKIQERPEIEMSISSLRVDAVDEIIIKTLVAGHQKHVTIAIEAGSERLRKVINKNISEKQILNTVKILRENGLKGVKIYAMLGIPTETQVDLDEMVKLAKKIKDENKGFDVSFAFSSFIPKPNTPLQWCGRFDTKELEKRQNFLKKEFHKIGIKASFSSVKWDYWQTVLSRGDENFTEFLLEVYRNGSKLGAFKKASKGKFNPDDYAIRSYDLDEILPWDFINIRPEKDVLKARNIKLLTPVEE